jgi:solute carrier family 10 (sodium/bile acid cotransporter), member 7
MSGFLARHWFTIALALGLGTALAWPAGLQHVTSWDPRYAVAVTLFLTAWTMPTHSLLAEARQPFASLWAVALSYGLVPAAAWLLGYFAEENVQAGLILIASVPCTLSAAVLWTRLAGGNEATALLTVMGTTVTSWFLTTGWLYWLTGAVLELDVYALALDLFLSLIVPVFVGQVLRLIRSSAELADRHRLMLGSVSQAFVLAMVIKAGVSVGERLHADGALNAPAILLWSIVLAVTLHLAALAAGFYSCRWLGFDRGRQIAVAFSASQKTLQVSLVLYEQYFRTRFPFAVMAILSYHVGQLLLDTIIAKQMRAHRSVDFSPRSPNFISRHIMTA